MKSKKNRPQNRGKPYLAPPNQYGNHPNNQRIVDMGFAGGSGSKPTTFSTLITCYKCGKPGHISSNCVDKGMTLTTQRNDIPQTNKHANQSDYITDRVLKHNPHGKMILHARYKTRDAHNGV